MSKPYAFDMERDEHALIEWAEYNVPLDIRALPPQPSPLGRRVISRQSLGAFRPAVEQQHAADLFWLLGRRPA
jgi:hypothetical protein